MFEIHPEPGRDYGRLFLKIFLWGLLVFSVLGGGITAGGALFLYDTYQSCDPNELALRRQNGENSFIYAANGALLGSIPSPVNRQPVDYDGLSPWLLKATVAIEDRRFYEHDGVDFRGIARAAWADFEQGRVVQGGSTITQQLVRHLYVGSERTFSRKLEEACLALKIEKRWPKQKILSEYLNRVYFGSRAYGAEAAARTYFSKSAADLTLPEAALIAGLPQSPSLYSPLVDPSAALHRRDQVLAALYANELIGRAAYDSAVRADLNLRPGVLYTRRRDSLFFNYVYDRLVERYGAQVAQQGGLRVYTTISPKLQRAAYRAVTDTLPGKDDPAAAVVSIDPQTGYIRAMAARAPTRRNLVFNLAAQGRRQPGSTFKVFALAEAIRRGIDPDRTFYMSAPFEFAAGPGAEPWQVGNGSGYYGSLSLREAIVRSDNTVFARLGLDLGPSRIAATARQLGIRSHLPGIPSLVLGTVPVTPLEMASAYATIASGGIYRQPEAIQEVRFPNGKKETAHRSRARRVLSEAQAALITDILGDAVSRGTGTGAQIGRPQAGKTGTTEDYSDAWFVGYVPQLATSVWVGYPARSVPMTNVHGITVYGGTFPAEIWRRFMWNALLKAPAREFPYASPPPFESWHGTAQWRSSATPSDLHG